MTATASKISYGVSKDKSDGHFRCNDSGKKVLENTQRATPHRSALQCSRFPGPDWNISWAEYVLPQETGAHITKPLARLCCKSLTCAELRDRESVTRPDSRSETRSGKSDWYLVRLGRFPCCMLSVFVSHSLLKASSLVYMPDLS